MWDRVQNLSNRYAFPERKTALDRLCLVTTKFNEEGSYGSEEQAAAHPAAVDPESQNPATESGSGREDQANDAADGGEIEGVPRCPSTVTGDQDDQITEPESQTTAMIHDDGHAACWDGPD